MTDLSRLSWPEPSATMGNLPSVHHHGTTHKLSSPLVRLALAGVLAAGLLALGVYLAVRGIAWAAEFSSVAAFFLGAAALIGPFIGRSLNQAGKPGRMSGEDEAAALSGLVRGELARSDDRLKSVSSRELQVGWKVASGKESATSEQQVGRAGQSGVGSGDFCRMFSALSPQRIVVHGTAGAGKTIFVTQVSRELLRQAEELLQRRNPPTIAILIPFYVSAGDDENRSCRDLRNRVDFAPFNRTVGSQLTKMSVDITGPPQLNHSDRAKLIDAALTYMLR